MEKETNKINESFDFKAFYDSLDEDEIMNAQTYLLRQLVCSIYAYVCKTQGLTYKQAEKFVLNQRIDESTKDFTSTMGQVFAKATLEAIAASR